MDYRKLLKKYMQHIISNEGVDHITVTDVVNIGTGEAMTTEEWNELQSISKEILDEEAS